MLFEIGAIGYAFIATLGFGLESGIAKKYTRLIDPAKVVVFRQFVIVSLLLIVLTFFKSINFNVFYILIGLALGLVGYFGLYMFFKAASVGEIGIVTPITGGRVVISTLIGLMVFSETINVMQGLAVLTIFIGLIAISIDPKKVNKLLLLDKNSGVLYAILTAIIWGLVFPFIRIPAIVLGGILTTLAVEFGALISSYITLKKSKLNLLLNNKSEKAGITGVILMGILGTIAGVAQTLSYATGNIGIVTSIIASSPLITALYGKLVYKERLTVLQYMAILLIVTGMISLSYFQS